MSVCILQNLEKYRVLWSDFLAACQEINQISVSKIGPEPAKPKISLALLNTMFYSLRGNGYTYRGSNSYFCLPSETESTHKVQDLLPLK